MTNSEELAKYVRTELKKLQDKYRYKDSFLDHDAEQLIVKIIHILEGTMKVPIELETEEKKA